MITLKEAVSQPTLFERAEALGVFIATDDLVKLLDAIHEQESKLMDLRHDVQRRIAGIIDGAARVYTENVR